MLSSYFSRPSLRFFSLGCLSCIGCLAPLAPVILGLDSRRQHETTILSTSLESRNFLIAAGITVGCTVPIFVEIIANLFDGAKQAGDYLERIFMLISLVVPYVFCFWDLTGCIGGHVFSILMTLTTNILVGAVFSCLSRIGEYPYSVRCLEIAFFLFVLCSIYRSCCIAWYGDVIIWYDISSYMFAVISVGLALSMTVCRPGKGSFDFKLMRYLVMFQSEKLSTEEYCWTFYAFVLIFSYIAVATVNYFTNGSSWSESNTLNLVLSTYVRTVLTVIICILPSRMMKQMQSASMRELGMQRRFVSYVSQELRSPLLLVSSDLTDMKDAISRMSILLANTYNIIRSKQSLKLYPTNGVVKFPLFSQWSSSKQSGVANSVVNVNFLNKMSSIGDNLDSCVTRLIPACRKANIIISDILVYNTMAQDSLELKSVVRPVVPFLQTIISLILQTHVNTSDKAVCGDEESLEDCVDSRIRLETNNVQYDECIHIDDEKFGNVLKSLLGNMLYYDNNNVSIDGKDIYVVVSLLKVPVDVNQPYSEELINTAKLTISLKVVRDVEPPEEGCEDVISHSVSSSFRRVSEKLFKQQSSDGMECSNSCWISSVNLWICKRVVGLHHGTVEIFSHSKRDASGVIGDVAHISLPMSIADSSISTRRRLLKAIIGKRSERVRVKELFSFCERVVPDVSDPSVPLAVNSSPVIPNTGFASPDSHVSNGTFLPTSSPESNCRPAPMCRSQSCLTYDEDDPNGGSSHTEEDEGSISRGTSSSSAMESTSVVLAAVGDGDAMFSKCKFSHCNCDCDESSIYEVV